MATGTASELFVNVNKYKGYINLSFCGNVWGNFWI